jgi:VCBS repeat-containing protein
MSVNGFRILSIKSDTGSLATDFVTKTSTGQQVTVDYDRGNSTGSDTVNVYLSGGSLANPVLLGTSTTASGTPSNVTKTYDLPSSLADGAYTLTMSRGDNNASFTVTKALVIDTTAPNAPVITTVTDDVAPVTGPLTSGATTNDTKLTMAGTAEAGSTVKVYDGGSLLGTATMTGGNWSYTTSALSAGVTPHSLTAIATDAAGNVGAASSAFQVIVDTTTPAGKATIGSIIDDYGLVTGTVNSGSSSDDTTPTLTGTSTGGGGQRIEIYVNSGTTFVGYTTSDSNGVWSFTASVDTPGSTTFNAYVVDAAGNRGPVDNAYTYKLIDTIPPDTYINANPSEVTTSNMAVFSFGSPEADVSYDYKLDGADWVLDDLSSQVFFKLSQGSHTLLARARDAAGNIDATPASFTWIVDTTAPNTLISTSPAAASNTKNSTFTFSVDDGVGSGVDFYELKLDNGSWTSSAATKTYTGLSETSHTLQVRATDKAGYTDPTPASYTWVIDTTAPTTSLTSTPSTKSTNASFTFSGADTGGTGVAGYEYLLDNGTWTATTGTTQALTGLSDGSHTFQVRTVDKAGNADASPASVTWTVDATVAAPTVALLSDTGTSSTDKITRTATLNVTGLESGATVAYSANGATNWGPSAPAPVQGDNTVYVRQTDTAGNVSTATKFDFFYDSQIATPTAGLQTDSGTSGDKITNDGTIKVTGTEAGATVQYSAVSGAGASWSTTAPALAQGSNTVYVRQVDIAGNSSAQYTLTFTYDSVANAPTVALATDSGTAGDSITSVGTLTVTGTEAGAKIEYSTTGSDGGSWSTTPPALTQGSNTVYVRQTDVAGNVSASTPIIFTYDTQAAAPTLTLTSDTGVAGDNITNNPALTPGGVEDGAKVEYSSNGTSDWKTTPPTATAGPNTIYVRQTDKAGNVSGSNALTFTLDTTAAAPTVGLINDSGVAGDKITNDGRLVVTGTETNAKVEFSATGANGSWSQTPPALTVGLNNVFVRQTDLAGNVSAPTPFSFTYDVGAAAPTLALTTDSGVAGDNITNAGALTVTGKEAGALVEYSADGSTGWSTSLPGAVQGSNTVYVRQTDVAGNVSQAKAFSFILDSTGPAFKSGATASVNEGATAAYATSTTDATSVTYALAAGGDSGLFNIDSTTGAVSFKTAPNYESPSDAGGDHVYNITVQATDAAGNVSTQTVAITVNDANEQPVGAPVTVSVAEDATGVLATASVSDPDAANGNADNNNGVLGYAITGGDPNHLFTVDSATGAVSLAAGKALDYETAQQHVLTVTATDRAGAGLSTTSTVTINVTNVNEAPVAVGDTYAVTEDTPFTATLANGLLVNDTDVDGDSLTAVLVNGPLHGVVYLNSDGTLKDGAFKYQPSSNYNGQDSFTYKVTDGKLTSAPVTVTLNVAAVNDAPTGVAPVTLAAIDEDSAPRTITTAELLGSAVDVDNTLSISNLAISNGKGTLVAGSIAGTWIYTPAANDDTSVSFTYKIVGDSDTGPISTSATLDITPVNDAPVAVGDTYAVMEDTPFTATLANGLLVNDTDVDGDSLTAVLVNGPLHGVVYLNSDGTLKDGAFKYQPSSNYNGQDSFTYKVTDGKLTSAPVTVTLNVAAVNDAPTVDHALTAQAFNEDTAWTYLVPADTFADIDSATLTYSATLANGSALPAWLHFDAATRTFSGTPPQDENGALDLKVIASDGQLSASSTFTVTINAVNDLPTGVAPVALTAIAEDSAPRTITTAELLGTAADVDNTLSVSDLAISTGKGSLVAGSTTGTWVYTPATNDDTSVSFTYKIVGDVTGPISTTATLDITPVNDAPTGIALVVLTAIAEDSGPRTITTAQLLGAAADVDNTLSVSDLAISGGKGTLVAGATTGTWIYTPAANDDASVAFTYKIVGDAAGPISTAATLDITPVNDLPTGVAPVALTAIAEDGTPRTITTAELLGTAADVDNTLSVSDLAISAGKGTLVAGSTAGTWVYTPAANDDTSVSFTYKITGDAAGPINTTATLDITPVNDAPVVANAIGAQSVNEDTAWAFTVPANIFADADGDALTYSATLDGGALPAWLSFNTSTGAFSGTPPLNFNGSYTIAVYASDNSKAAAAVSTFTLTVAPVNDAPVVANAIGAQSVNEDTAWAFTVPANTFADADGDALAYSATLDGAALPAWLSFNTSTGAFSGTPPLNFNGSYTIAVYASDNSKFAAAVSTFTLTVAPVNDAPVVANAIGAQSVNEDTAWAFTVPANTFADADGDALTYSATLDGAALPAWLSFNTSTGAFSGTPPLNFNGSYTIAVYASDNSKAAAAVSTFTLTVAPVNDAPVAVADTYAVTEDTPFSATLLNGVLKNDTDADGDKLSATLVTGPGHGAVTLNADGTFTYTPAANYNGVDSFTYKVNDGTTDSAPVTVTLNVAAVNDLPTGAAPTTLTAIAEDSAPRTITTAELLGTLSDVDSTLSIKDLAISAGGKGTLAAGSTAGTWVYTPAANDDTAVTFTYKITGDAGGDLNGSVTLDITPVNDAPTGAAPTTLTAIAEDSAPRTITTAELLGTLSDVDSTLSIKDLTISGGGKGVLVAGATPGTWVYTPALNDDTSVSFTYKIAGDVAGDLNGSVTLDITPVNDAPIAVDDIYYLNEDGVVSQPGPGHFANDTDPDQGDVEFQGALVSGPQHGTLTGNGKQGGLVYTPNANYNGDDSFTYTITDKDGATSNVATVKFVVAAVNDAPVADAALTNQSGSEDTAVSFALPAGAFKDVDGDALTYSATLSDGSALPSWLVFDATTRSFSGTPTLNWNGALSIKVTASDAKLSASQTFTLNIAAVNDAPTVAGPLGATATEDGSTVSISALQGATDVENDTLTVTNLPATLPDGVTYNAATKTFTLDPAHASFQSLAQGATKVVTVSYKISDGHGGSVDQTASWTVTGTNDLPVANNDAYTVDEDGFLTILPADGVFKNDTDVDFKGAFGGALIATTKHGAFVGTGDGGFTYKPDADFNGTDTFTYQAIDDHGNSNTATVTITVVAKNDAPVVVGALSASVNEDTGVSTVAALSNASDVDGDKLTVTDIALQPGVTYDADSKSFKLDTTNAAYQTLKAGATKDVVVTYKVYDGAVKVDNSIKWTVTGVNDAPTVGVIPTTAVNEDGVSTVSGLIGAADVDSGDTLSVTDVGVLPAGVTQTGDSFTLNAADTAYQSLKAGATQTVTVDFKVFDGAAKVDRHITWTITGTNDAPVVIGHVMGAVNEDASSTLSALSNATDPDAGDTLTVSDIGTLPAGVTYDAAAKSFKLDAGNTAYQSLKDGATKEVTVTYKVYDSTTKVDDSITWTVTGKNDAPTVVALNNKVSINENSAAGTFVGDLATTDVDSGDTVTYSITSGGSNFEVINGKLYVKAGADLNYEDGATTSVTVLATDGSGASKSQSFSVTLKDVNDNTPAFATPTKTFTVTENNGLTVDTVHATDADGTAANNTITYTLQGTDAAPVRHQRLDRRPDPEGRRRLRDQVLVQADGEGLGRLRVVDPGHYGQRDRRERQQAGDHLDGDAGSGAREQQGGGHPGLDRRRHRRRSGHLLDHRRR